MKHRVMALAGLCLLAFSFSAAGHEPTVSSQSGLRAELVAEIDAVEKKLVSLAGAVPAEKFGWRPAQGIRSVSEVYMHVAGANYMVPGFVGVKPPAGIDRGMEKTVTEKGKVVETLKQSFEHLRGALKELPDADFDKKVKVFGRDASGRSVFLLLLNHAHEHLGQSIAYARSNGVAPPWSEEPSPAPAPKAGDR